MGMGGAFTGLADDVNAIFINPAGITAVKKESALVSTRLVKGREYTMFGGVEQTPFGSLGIGYVGSTDPVNGNLDLANWDGGSPVKYTTQTLYVSLAQDLNRRIRIPASLGDLSLGVNFKFSSRKIGTTQGLSTDGGSNIDVDLASVFKPNDNLSLGLSLQNFLNGRKTQNIPGLSTVEEKNSAVLAGVSGKLLGDKIIWSVDGNEVGCEWKAADAFSLRAGRGNGSFSAGFGVNINGFILDYAFLNGAEPVHYWSVSIAPLEPKVLAEPEDNAKFAKVGALL